jgi:hypothetical protein
MARGPRPTNAHGVAASPLHRVVYARQALTGLDFLYQGI